MLISLDDRTLIFSRGKAVPFLVGTCASQLQHLGWTVEVRASEPGSCVEAVPRVICAICAHPRVRPQGWTYQLFVFTMETKLCLLTLQCRQMTLRCVPVASILQILR